MTDSQKKIMRMLVDKYKLEKDHVFIHQHYTILKREAIDIIQAKEGIEIEYEWIANTPDLKTVVLKAVGRKGETIIETFGEASPANNKNAYPISMAEKRAMSRIVLKLAGVYGKFVMGEDESEEFKEQK